MSAKPIAVVTGGAGFIGGHMVDVLVEHGFAVRGGHHTDAARAQCAKDVAEFCHAVTAKG